MKFKNIKYNNNFLSEISYVIGSSILNSTLTEQFFFKDMNYRKIAG